MKRVVIVLTAAILLAAIRYGGARDTSFNRVIFSLTLSGHILTGVGFEHGFDTHHALQVTAYPFMLPGKGLPFAFSAGYNYYYGRNKWRGKIGGAFALLVSPPDPDKRKTMPLLLLTPGIQYHFDPSNSAVFQPWLAVFLKKAKHRFAPIGLEFRYGHNF